MFLLKNKKCAAEAAHEKHTTSIAATQALLLAIREDAKQEVCVFAKKQNHILANRAIHLCRTPIITHRSAKCKKKIKPPRGARGLGGYFFPHPLSKAGLQA